MIYFQDDEVYEPLKPKLPYETDIVKCSCCEKDLVKVFIPDITLETPLVYQFSCPYCGEASFRKTFHKKIWFDPINLKILDVKYDSIINVELTHGKKNP